MTESPASPNRPLIALIQDLATQLVPPVGHGLEVVAGDLDELTDLVADLRLILSEFERALEQQMGKMHQYEITTKQGTWVRQKRLDRKSWDHPRVGSLVAARAVERREPSPEGEVADPTETAVRALLRAAGISYWRIGELKNLGIDGNQFCDVTDNGYTVRRK